MRADAAELSIPGHRILCVTADAEDRRRASLIAAALRRAGAVVTEVRVAEHGDAAIERAIERALITACPSLVLLLASEPACRRPPVQAGLPTVNLASASDPGFARLAAELELAQAAHRQMLLVLDDAAPTLTTIVPVIAIGPLGYVPSPDAPGPLAYLVELAHATRGALRAFEASDEPPEPPWLVPREAFVDYLVATSPPLEVDRSKVEAMLDQGDGLELPSWQLDHGRAYHRFFAWNWLYHKSAAFYEMEARARRATRARAELLPERRDGGRCCLARDLGPPTRVAVRPQPLRVTLTYELDVAEMAAGTRVRLYMPYPLSTDSQRDVRLTSCDPPALASALVAEHGYVFGAELTVDASAGLRASYAATLTSHEIHSHGLHQALRPGASSMALGDLLRDLSAGSYDVVTKAWLIYDWMLANGRFEKTLNRCTCPPCAAKDFERDRAGHCIVFAHAFMAYCDRVGVRTRPVRGALFTHARDAAGRRFGVTAPVEPVIGHTWVEVDVPGVGWLPVEFHASAWSGATPENCRDPELREALSADFQFLRELYFGGLDNQRIVFSTSALAIAPARYYDPVQAPGQRWVPVPLGRFRSELEIVYS